jgi:hypothetical protein
MPLTDKEGIPAQSRSGALAGGDDNAAGVMTTAPAGSAARPELSSS